tara:strand:- start:133 stop:369 length:237 start_codon:yes stop_codon:yes gene_type:complete
MSLRNPAVQLYNLINAQKMEKPKAKKNNNSLLRKNTNRNNTMNTTNNAIKPLISMINHLSVIKNKRDEINETTSTTII